jgi:protein-serine/threonine kinase
MMEQDDGFDKMEDEPSNLPTPPHSLLQHESDDMELGTSPGVSSIFTTLKNYLAPPAHTPPDDSPSRRQTSLPVSSISDDPVLATHFSNPSIPSPSDDDSLTEAPLLDHEKLHDSVSSENLSKLTRNAPDGSRLKNTPPLTPRAMSNEAASKSATSAPTETPIETPTETPTETRSETPEEKPESKSDDMESSTDEITMKLDEAFPSQASSSPANGAPTSPINGKLFVKITAGRGLRPSFDPYVVCVFEWNEYISKGARDGEGETKRRQQESDAAEEAAGRPMAIPLKTRSSSHNSGVEDDHKGRKLVTDPNWDHEATLYATTNPLSDSTDPLIFPLLLVMLWEISQILMLQFTIAITRKLSWATYVFVSTSRKTTVD